MAKSKDSVSAILEKARKKLDLPVGPLGEIIDTNVKAISTGSMAIDYAIGVGGLPVGRSVELFGPTGSSKAQPLTANVLTPEGFVPMGSLAVGDEVIDPEGSVGSRVVGIFPQGVKPIYRITFNDGTSCEATEDHLWDVWLLDKPRVKGDYNAPRKGVWVRKTVDTGYLRKRLQAKRFNMRMPEVEPVEFPERELRLDPYFLGLLLGDGNFSEEKCVSFTTADAETLQAIQDVLPESVNVRLKMVNGRSATVSLTVGNIGGGRNPLVKDLRALGLLGKRSWEKFIPDEYKVSGVKQRLAILQGLMDTDGNRASGKSVFTSTSKQLRDDVAWIARSLGLIVTEHEYPSSYKDKSGTTIECRTAYKACIAEKPEIRIFRLERKLAKPLSVRMWPRKITSIEYARDEEAQCIKVSAASEMYVTDDFIPTHNTTTALQSCAKEQQRIIAEGTEEYILYLDYEHAIDSNYAANLGLDMSHRSFLIAQPETLEQGAELAVDLIETGQVRILVIDSIAAMMPASMYEAEVGKVQVAPLARALTPVLQRLNPVLHHNNTLALYINHLKEVIDGSPRPAYVGPQKTTPGGKGLKFYSSVRLEFVKVKTIKGTVLDAYNQGQDVEVASNVQITVVKNKVGPPARRAKVRNRFGRGFDDMWSALQVLAGHKKIVKSGTWYYFERIPELVHPEMGGTRAGLQGENAVLNFADTHPEWREKAIEIARDILMNLGAESVVDSVELDTDEDDDVSSENRVSFERE